jgi:hypothetical protein
MYGYSKITVSLNTNAINLKVLEKKLKVTSSADLQGKFSISKSQGCNTGQREGTTCLLLNDIVFFINSCHPTYLPVTITIIFYIRIE